jgi:hypothetical protein
MTDVIPLPGTALNDQGERYTPLSIINLIVVTNRKIYKHLGPVFLYE